MALTVASMPLNVSVGDVAASITQSDNGIMLKLPVSLSLPIVELLAALQSVQGSLSAHSLSDKHVLNELNDFTPDMAPEEPKEPLQFRLPGASSSSEAQTESSLHGSLGSLRRGSTYDITSSKKKWILNEEDFAVLENVPIKRMAPTPIKRMTPTPEVGDLAALEAKAEEAFRKAIAMQKSFAATSSLRLPGCPPETPPPLNHKPEPRQRLMNRPKRALSAVATPSGPDDAATNLESEAEAAATDLESEAVAAPSGPDDAATETERTKSERNKEGKDCKTQ